MRKYEEIYRKYLADIPEICDDQVTNLFCPFHVDTTRGNLSVNLETGLFNCFSCGEKGTVFDFYAKIEGVTRDEARQIINANIIEPSFIETWIHNLSLNDKMLAFLTKERKLTNDVIKKYKLGYDPSTERITIPIFSENSLANVRKYRPYAQSDKYIGIRGKNQALWFPEENLNNDVIFICEGEMDCLAAISAGIPAVTCTIPINIKAFDQIIYKLKFKKVILLYDGDKAGRKMAQEAIAKLHIHVEGIKNIIFPEDTKDVTAYLNKYGKAALDKLILETQWEGRTPLSSSFDERNYEEIEFVDLFNPAYINKRISVVVDVVGIERDKYSVPKILNINCPCNFKYCNSCPLSAYGGQFEKKYDPNNRKLLELISVTDVEKKRRIKEDYKIPQQCRSFEITHKYNYTVEHYVLQQSIDYYMDHIDNKYNASYISGYNIGDISSLEIGKSYKVFGKTTSSPKTQATVFIIDTYEEIQEERFTSNIDVFSDLKKLDSIKDMFDSRVNELSDIIGIKQRYDLVALGMITYHTPLELMINDSLSKGCLDVLIIGDSTTGKTATFKRLMRLYKCGEIISGEGGTNERGIIGGVVEAYKGAWTVVWGKIPKAHKGLYVIDEFQLLDSSILDHLSTIRRDGVATITKIATSKIPALARSVLISNIKSNLLVDQFGYGIQAVPDLIKAKQDITRFDTVLIVSSSETKGIIATDELKLTKDLVAHSLLVKKVWGLYPSNVIISEDTLKLSYELDGKLTKKYTCDIPLIDGATTYKKILRIAAGMAGSLNNFKDENLIVSSNHVKLAYEYMQMIYDKQACAFNSYAAAYSNKYDNFDKENVKLFFDDLNISSKKEFIQALIISDIVTHQHIIDLSGMSRDNTQDFVSFLIRKGAFQRTVKGFTKTHKFNIFLREYLDVVSNEITTL